MIKNYVWRGGGVPGGGFKHAGHADWFTEMNPVSNMAPGNPPKPSGYSTPFYGDLKIPPIKYRQKKSENVMKPAPGQNATLGNVPGPVNPERQNIDGRNIGPGQLDPYSATEIPNILSPSESNYSEQFFSDTSSIGVEEEVFRMETIEQDLPMYGPVQGDWSGILINARNNLLESDDLNSNEIHSSFRFSKPRSSLISKDAGDMYDDQYNPFARRVVTRMAIIEEETEPTSLEGDPFKSVTKTNTNHINVEPIKPKQRKKKEPVEPARRSARM